MDKKHTPGPWYLIATDGADFTAISTKPKIKGDLDLESEVLGSSEWLRAEPEDLRLMAAAPELLKALEEVVRIHGTDRDGWPIEHGYIGNAREAIAKAKAVQS